MEHEALVAELWRGRDSSYQIFQSSLLPTIDPQTIIGVKIPLLRKIAKSFVEKEDFMQCLPHKYFEENIIHSILLSEEKDFFKTIPFIQAFLPYIDNWSVCDTLIPKSFQNAKEEVLPYVYQWIASSHAYTCRFGIGVLMRYFLKENFDISFLEEVAKIQSEEYYVKMMVAWYFATALAFVYEDAVPYLENHRLDYFTHQKTIQKAIESFRVPDYRKQYLKTLRYKKQDEL